MNQEFVVPDSWDNNIPSQEFTEYNTDVKESKAEATKQSLFVKSAV